MSERFVQITSVILNLIMLSVWRKPLEASYITVVTDSHNETFTGIVHSCITTMLCNSPIQLLCIQSKQNFIHKTLGKLNKY